MKRKVLRYFPKCISIACDHTQRLESLNNHTQPPKSLIKSMEIPNINSCLFVDHTQSVKPLHVSEEGNHHKLKCTSPRVPNDKGVGNDTTGDMCHWLPKDGLLPHHNQCPEIHDKICEVFPAHLDGFHPNIGMFH